MGRQRGVALEKQKHVSQKTVDFENRKSASLGANGFQQNVIICLDSLSGWMFGPEQLLVDR